MNLNVMSDGSEQINYQNPAVPIYIGYGLLQNFSNMASLCHWHEDVELVMPVKGYLSYNINGNRVFVGEGDAIFVNSRQMHYGYTSDGSDCEYICICFKPDLLCGHTYFYEQYVIPILMNQSFPYLVLRKEKPEHSRLLNLIRFIGKIKERNLILMGKLHELWQEIYDLIYDLAETERDVNCDENVQIFRQMVAFVNEKYQERISLAQMAAAGGVCRSKCCQIFKKYMGYTPNDYVNLFRLEKAMVLLRESDLTITEVANAVGFGSSSYFAEIFSKQKGCTPTTYRKRCKSGFWGEEKQNDLQSLQNQGRKGGRRSL